MLFLYCTFLGQAAAEAVSVDAIIKKIEKTYKDVESIEADFTQITSNAALPEPMEQTGHLYMMKPQFVRWDFQTPMVQSYYSDGKSITVWNELNNQVLISNQMGQANELIEVLTDLSKLSAKYDLRLKEETEKAYSIAVQPKKEAENQNAASEKLFDTMELSIDKSSYLLESIWVQGELSGEIRLSFGNVQLNTISDASVFNFKPPEGAEVIKTEGM